LEAAIGHALLAVLPETRRKSLLAALAGQYGAAWPEHEASIAASLVLHGREGFCRSRAIIGAAGMSTALPGPYGVIYAVGISFSAAADEEYAALEARFLPVLRTLAESMRDAWAEFASV
jgi:DNA-binding IclR family transcriptional regulator